MLRISKSSFLNTNEYGFKASLKAPGKFELACSEKERYPFPSLSTLVAFHSAQ